MLCCEEYSSENRALKNVGADDREKHPKERSNHDDAEPLQTRD